MFDEFYKDLTYEEYDGIGINNQPIFKTAVTIKGIRLKGYIKVTHSNDGDTTTSSLCYRTTEELKPNSRLNGRVIMECTPVNALWVDEESAGYISYVK